MLNIILVLKFWCLECLQALNFDTNSCLSFGLYYPNFGTLIKRGIYVRFSVIVSRGEKLNTFNFYLVLVLGLSLISTVLFQEEKVLYSSLREVHVPANFELGKVVYSNGTAWIVVSSQKNGTVFKQLPMKENPLLKQVA